MLDELLNQLKQLAADPLVKILVAHIVINLVVAVAAAIKTHTLDLAKMKAFVLEKVLPSVLVFAVAKFIGQAAKLEWLAAVAWAALEADLLRDLTDSLSKLGMPMPDILKKDHVLAIAPLLHTVSSDTPNPYAEG